MPLSRATDPYIARRAEILGSYRIGETWYHNDR